MIVSIKKEGEGELLLYHHSDDYIKNGVGEYLVKYLKREKKSLDYNGWDCERIANDLIKAADAVYKITVCKNCMSAYRYEIDCDKKQLSCLEGFYKRDERVLYKRDRK